MPIDVEKTSTKNIWWTSLLPVVSDSHISAQNVLPYLTRKNRLTLQKPVYSRKPWSKCFISFSYIGNVVCRAPFPGYSRSLKNDFAPFTALVVDFHTGMRSWDTLQSISLWLHIQEDLAWCCWFTGTSRNRDLMCFVDILFLAPNH